MSSALKFKQAKSRTMYQLEITDLAKGDLREATYYYEEIGFGIGGRFLNQYRDVLLKIQDRPHSLRFKKGQTRFARLKSFPFLVFFHLDEPRQVATVFAILHEKRHPDAWEKRI